jgi:hypothetical protein
MSPRTVGRYRPHVTCVPHVAGGRQAGVGYSINLDSEKLPEEGRPEAYRRECYLRLIGTT